MRKITNKEKEISKIILDYLEKIEFSNSILRGDLLNKEEKNFLIENPNAFVIGLISDQSVKAELAWSLPYRLSLRLKTFDFKEILSNYNVSDIENIIRTKPSLHRYPGRMAVYIYEAMKKIVEMYDSNAGNIWNNKNAQEIVDSLEEFKGISHKKASLGTLILVRDLDINVLDKENIDIAYDVHIRRLFYRIGLVDIDTQEKILESARFINPSFPGRLTTAFWQIGRDICRPTNPECLKCPLYKECDKKLDLN